MAFGIRVAMMAWAIVAIFASREAMSQAAAPTTTEPAQRLANALMYSSDRVIRLPKTGSSTQTTLKIGDTLPPVKCRDLDAKSVEIKELFGEKATLVVFWATWCGACLNDLPRETRLSAAYRDKGLRVIGVNADDDPARAKIAIELFHVGWPTIYEPRENQSDDGIVKSLGVTVWPTLLLFDGDRKLILATPELREIHLIRDSANNSYSVRSLDAAFSKILGPLNYVPYLSIVE